MPCCIKLTLYAVIVCLLLGCGTKPPKAPYRAPVDDINRAPPKLQGTHVVQPGESFYMIAWRYNRDAEELARINHLHPPYALKAGQRIELGRQFHAKTSASPPATYVSTPVMVKKTTPSATKPILHQGGIAWEWPVKGKIIANFASQNGQKGIDIAGQNGQSVITAAPGVVVYSGSGLRGYGQMIIIKHNDQFLSAYAHNSRLLVKEGDVVVAHSKIAEMGQTDTESVRLHFEIRKNGQPVDPLMYLP